VFGVDFVGRFSQSPELAKLRVSVRVNESFASLLTSIAAIIQLDYNIKIEKTIKNLEIHMVRVRVKVLVDAVELVDYCCLCG
jgi:hypothetical protein